jgi:type 2 lantibiotic biosynthesis protein LanM
MQANDSHLPKLEKIYASSASIDEILSSDFVTAKGNKENSKQACLRLAQWCNSAAGGDWSLFAQRLARDGLSFDFVLGRFANAICAHGVKFPQWVLDAEWIREIFNKNRNMLHVAKPDDKEKKIPFEDIFRNLIEEIGMALSIDSRKNLELNFNAEAIADLRRQLTLQIGSFMNPVLMEKYLAYKRENFSKDIHCTVDDVASNDVFCKYVEFMKNFGIFELYEERPVLLRITASVVRQWIFNTENLISRFEKDKSILINNLLKEICRQDIRIKSITSEVSDPHNFGQSVLIIEFGNSKKIVYKPKDCRIDHQWSFLIQRLNAEDAPIQLRTAEIIGSESYGWSEFIENTACKTVDEINLYYGRAGAWLCLFYLYSGTDMHNENLIACGDHPVPIDIEMLLQNVEMQQLNENSIVNMGEDLMAKISDSVMMTGMLPNVIKNVDGRIIRDGGLDYDNSDVVAFKWLDVNTNNMRMCRLNEKHASPKNIPMYSGSFIPLNDYLDSFIQGFRDYASFIYELAKGRDDKFFFHDFEGLNTRKVFRPTRFYYSLLKRLKDDRQMSDGINWSSNADFISRFFDWNMATETNWPVAAEERHALLDLNVPYFWTSVEDQLDMHSYRGLIATVHGKAGIQRSKEKLKRLNHTEIEYQVSLIKASSLAQAKLSDYRFSYRPPEIMERSENYEKLFDKEAVSIADHLADLASQNDDGANWLGFNWASDHTELARLAPLGPDLYNGSTGVALFLAAIARYKRNARLRQLALSTISPIRLVLNGRNSSRVARQLGIGGATGLGSIIYALTSIAEILGEKSLLEDSFRASELFTNELIDLDKHLDVMQGAAGGIIGLLKLNRIVPDSRLIERAQYLGNHLLKKERIVVNGKKSWMGAETGNVPLCGFSHGASGYAYALSCLSKVCGDLRYQAAAIDCLDFEDSRFQRHVSNWPPECSEYLSTRDALTTSRWCHGAVGVGISRVGMLKYSDLPQHRLVGDIEKALKGAIVNDGMKGDSLCCGGLGHIEFFDEYGKISGNDYYCQLAKSRLSDIIGNTKDNRFGYRFGGVAEGFHVSLFRGLAGVGYTLLRQLDDSLPNVLYFD